jgi:1-acyl-sn-glycerol-3-phosphate acyltransferase
MAERAAAAPGDRRRARDGDRGSPMMSLVRALLFNLAFWLDTAFWGVLGLPFLLTPRRTAMRFGRFWAQTVLALLKLLVGLDGEIRGRGNLPPGGVLIAMKHQSAWDTLILPPLLGDPAVVIKQELRYVPFYGWYAARAGSIFIDRKGGAAALRRMVAAARQAIAAGRPVVIFPQGTRTAPGQSAPYQPGIAALYRELGVKLVPAAVNSGLYWGRRAFRKRRGRIILEFLEPIPPGLPRREMMALLETRIETATAALEREADLHGTGTSSWSQAPTLRTSE